MYSTYTHWTAAEAVRINAAGGLTSDQAARIERALAIGKVVWWPYILLMLLSSSPIWWPGEGALWTTRSGWLPALSSLGFTTFIVVMIGGTDLAHRRLVARTRADLARSNVSTAEGTVKWGRNSPYYFEAYIARVGYRQLRTTDIKLNLKPGAYRFYFLAESGWLLSAEVLDSVPAHKIANEHLRRLAERHGFTLSELEANRRGHLTARQRLSDLLIMVGAWLGAGLFGLLALMSSLTANLLGNLILIGLAAFVAYMGTRRARSAFNGQVAHLDGRVYVRYAGGSRNSRVYYNLNGREFELTQAQAMRMAYLVIVEGRRYRVYFTPGEKRIVSLEPIDQVQSDKSISDPFSRSEG